MTQTSIALLFPGQGSQYVGMGQDLIEAFPYIRDIFESADDILGIPLTKIMLQGPHATLLQTQYSQLAIFLHSYAVFSFIQQHSSLPIAATAGLSLGEYTALVASERLSFEEALTIIRQRSLFMQEACSHNPGAMAAIIGLDVETIASTLQELQQDVWIANYNAPKQIVISGRKHLVEQTLDSFKHLGAKKTVLLDVAGAFHSPLMISAENQLAPILRRANFRNSNIPIISNVLGDFVNDSMLVDILTKQITSPTKWYQGCFILNEYVESFLEIGCGKVLAGLNRLMGCSKPTYNINSVATIEQWLS